MERKKESRLFKIKQKHKINVRGVDFIATSFNGNDVSLKNLEPLFYFFYFIVEEECGATRCGVISITNEFGFILGIFGGDPGGPPM